MDDSVEKKIKDYIDSVSVVDKRIDDEFVVDVKSNIENKIKEFINNNSGSISGYQLCFIPLTFRELEDFMLLMRQRYSHKVDIHWFYDIQSFRVQFILQKQL